MFEKQHTRSCIRVANDEIELRIMVVYRSTNNSLPHDCGSKCHIKSPYKQDPQFLHNLWRPNDFIFQALIRVVKVVKACKCLVYRKRSFS